MNKYLLSGFLVGWSLFLLIEGLIFLFIEQLGIIGIGLSWIFLIPLELVFDNLNILYLYLISSIFYGLIGLGIGYLIYKIKK